MKKATFKRLIALILALSMILSFGSCASEDDESDDGVGAETKKFNTADLWGKIAIINVWGTWCPPCKAELPEFDRIASEYSDEVTVIAVHSTSEGSVSPEDYVKQNFPSSNIIFLKDQAKTGEYIDEYYSLIGGEMYYPYTVILDKNGVISGKIIGATDYERLESEIKLARLSGSNNYGSFVAVGTGIGDLCPTMELKYLKID